MCLGDDRETIIAGARCEVAFESPGLIFNTQLEYSIDFLRSFTASSFPPVV